MKTTCCLLLALLAAVSSAQWRKVQPGTLNYLDTLYNQSYEAYRWTNTSGSSQLHTNSGSYVYYQKVTGSDDTGPSWGAKFTPKSDSGNTLDIDWSFSETVPAGKIVGIDVKFSEIEDGKETWYYSAAEIEFGEDLVIMGTLFNRASESGGVKTREYRVLFLPLQR